MPTARKKTAKKKTRPKSVNKPRKTSRSRKPSSTARPHRVKRVLGRKEEVTYLYECTRPGCGYKIVRDEKAEPGQLRGDWKCPKCHHIEFRCLGKGDLPDSFQVSASADAIDFDAMRTSQIGSN